MTLPHRAAGAVTLTDQGSGTTVRFALEGCRDAAVAIADGIAVYPAAFEGADVIHRVHETGAEDFVVFEGPPSREALSYHLDVSGVAGLRLVGNTLEFLDPGGTPRLRVAPPVVVDALGRPSMGTLALSGCAVDRDPAPPWGRPVVSPGAASCSLHVAWHAEAYPVIVDPNWTTTGSMATARNNPGSALLGSGRVLVAGGANDNGYLASAELYDPPSGTFASTGTMTEARSSVRATLLLTGKVLLPGGYSPAAGELSSTELYDPLTGQFSASGSMGVARAANTTTLLPSGKVLVAGGTAYPLSLPSAELYDPGTGKFTTAGAMTTPRNYHSATVLPSGHVLVAGGRVGTDLASAELFDPGTETFAATGSMKEGRHYHVAARLPSGRVLVAGGGVVLPYLQYKYLSSAELYDPSLGTFSATSPMSASRYGARVSVLPSGRVLVSGGLFESGSDVYDPVSEKFLAGGTMSVARAYHAAAALTSGKVLVAGGASGPWSSAELFAPMDLANGAPCVVDGECASGFCVAGVCCGTVCSAPCNACSKSTGADVDGTCKPFSGPKCYPGEPCTSGGTCQAGSCVASPVACSQLDECHDIGVCQPVSGTCTTPSKPDGTPCAGGACSAGVCVVAAPADSGVDGQDGAGEASAEDAAGDAPDGTDSPSGESGGALGGSGGMSGVGASTGIDGSAGGAGVGGSVAQDAGASSGGTPGASGAVSIDGTGGRRGVAAEEVSASCVCRAAGARSDRETGRVAFALAVAWFVALGRRWNRRVDPKRCAPLLIM